MISSDLTAFALFTWASEGGRKGGLGLASPGF